MLLGVWMALLSAENECVSSFCEDGGSGYESWEMFYYMSHTSIQPINININKQVFNMCMLMSVRTVYCAGPLKWPSVHKGLT